MVDYLQLRDDQGNLTGKNEKKKQINCVLNSSMKCFFLFANSAGGMQRKRDYTPLSWQIYFESTKDVSVNGKNVSFH